MGWPQSSIEPTHRNHMKTKMFLALLVAASVGLQAADKGKEKDLPPGLRKKETLPPGIAKKRGADAGRTTVVTTNVIVTNVMVTNIQARTPHQPAPVVTQLPRREAKVDLDRHIRAINSLDNRDAVRRAGLSAVAEETGVSVSTLQKQRRGNPNVGTAGLLVANVIAAVTPGGVAVHFRQHAAGKSWERIAADHQVNFDELQAKLARVENVMRAVK
jgi:hypothetical protein